MSHLLHLHDETICISNLGLQNDRDTSGALKPEIRVITVLHLDIYVRTEDDMFVSRSSYMVTNSTSCHLLS
jgi:autonomous glycyl radical cofactor GrcA